MRGILILRGDWIEGDREGEGGREGGGGRRGETQREIGGSRSEGDT